MKALLIVDVQKDFCEGGALPVPKGDDIIPIINSIVDKFSLIVASKDWHNRESKHFEKWPLHCIQNTSGAEFHENLHKEKIDQIFLKGTGINEEGYSAFESTNMDLEKYLKERNVRDLYLVGLATDYCVKNSAVDATRRGFQVYLIKDAIKGIDLQKGDVDQAISEMKKEGVKLIRSTEL